MHTIVEMEEINMDLNELKQNVPLYEKLLLAYWYSIPSDSNRTPDKITIKFETNKVICYNLYKNNVNYGGGTMPQRELTRYIEKLNALDLSKSDIVKRFDKELVYDGKI
jgi:hypothetical protein